MTSKNNSFIKKSPLNNLKLTFKIYKEMGEDEYSRNMLGMKFHQVEVILSLHRLKDIFNSQLKQKQIMFFLQMQTNTCILNQEKLLIQTYIQQHLAFSILQKQMRKKINFYFQLFINQLETNMSLGKFSVPSSIRIVESSPLSLNNFNYSQQNSAQIDLTDLERECTAVKMSAAAKLYQCLYKKVIQKEYQFYSTIMIETTYQIQMEQLHQENESLVEQINLDHREIESQQVMVNPEIYIEVMKHKLNAAKKLTEKLQKFQKKSARFFFLKTKAQPRHQQIFKSIDRPLNKLSSQKKPEENEISNKQEIRVKLDIQQQFRFAKHKIAQKKIEELQTNEPHKKIEKLKISKTVSETKKQKKILLYFLACILICIISVYLLLRFQRK